MATKKEVWERRGTCRTNKKIDPDLFFSSDDFRSPATRRTTLNAEELEAIAICGRCPVSGNCLKYALDDPRLLGIWGGTTRDMRRALRKIRHRASCPRCEKGRVQALDDGETQVCMNCGLSWLVA